MKKMSVEEIIDEMERLVDDIESGLRGDQIAMYGDVLPPLDYNRTTDAPHPADRVGAGVQTGEAGE